MQHKNTPFRIFLTNFIKCLFLFPSKIKDERTTFKKIIKKLNSYNFQSVYDSIKKERIPLKTKKILFIIPSLTYFGGVETRLNLYATQLKQMGYDVHILTEYHFNNKIKAFKNHYLKTDAPNYAHCLNKLVQHFQFDIIEFELSSMHAFLKADLNTLRKHAKVGYVIHNVVNESLLKNKNVDYKIAVSDKLNNQYKSSIPGFLTIKNTWGATQNIYQFAHQKKALLITRIDFEKLPHIQSFIEFCQDMHIKFDILGGEDGKEEIIHSLQKKYDLPSHIFLGEMDGETFLKKSVKKYLFIAGVGQSILSAANMGYPVFLASHIGKNYSTFLSAANAHHFIYENFTIKSLDIYKITPLQQRKDFENIKKGLLQPYLLQDFIQKELNFQMEFKKYLQIIS